MTDPEEPAMGVTEAAAVLEQRRGKILDERKAVEEACQECGLQLGLLRQQRAEQERELAAINRMLYEYSRRSAPPEPH